jgi:hypothetical protein
MLEGKLAGVSAAARVLPDADRERVEQLRREATEGLKALRGGPFGAQARSGKAAMYEIAATVGTSGGRE